MGYQRFLVVSCFFLLPLSNCLLLGKRNVCSRPRLMKVSDVYPSNWKTAWDCQSSYPESSCERIRSGGVDIESVYFIGAIVTCCPGWKQSEGSQSCDEACQPGYYGEDCAFECRCLGSSDRTNCDAEDGSCDCLTGWMGRECDQRCDSELGCSSEDPQLNTCENGGTFHPAIESCLCKIENDGLSCEIQCPTSDSECGQVRCESCITANRESCDISTNFCRCKNGWTGRYCTDPCPSGTGGNFCREECCSGNGHCIEGLRCLCNDGFYGDGCQERCPDGYFGRNCTQECTCPSSVSCDPVTGQCLSCPVGFQGKNCTQRCQPTEWGTSCASPCACDSNEACEVFSGECEGVEFGDYSQTTFIIILVAACALLAVGFSCGIACCLCRNHFKERRSAANSTPNNEDTRAGDRTSDMVLSVNGYATEVNAERDNRNSIKANIDHPVVTNDNERNLGAQGSLYHQYEDIDGGPTLPARVRLQGVRADEVNRDPKDVTHFPNYAHAIYTVS